MEIKLKEFTVKLKPEMTWGDSQKIESTFLSSAKMKGGQDSKMNFDFDGTAVTKAKYIAIEVMIETIKKGDEEISYSEEWLNNLSLTDGEKLHSAVEELTKKK